MPRHVDARQVAERRNEWRREARERGDHRMPGPKPGTPRPRRCRPWDPDRDPPYKLMVPENLDPESLPSKLRWPALYFLHLVKWRYGTWRANADGFSQLKRAYLIKIIPTHLWRPIRHLLNQRGIIEEDGDVRPGEKCRGYRLTPDYRIARMVACPDPNVNAAIHRLRQRQDQDFQPVHFWLQEKLQQTKFDLDLALPIIGTLKPTKLSTREHRQQRSEHAKLLAGTPWLLDVDKFGRVHTPVTSLEKELRPCLSAGGEPLVWVDLKNSQPLLLGMLVRKWLSHSPRAQNRLLHRKFDSKNPYHMMEKCLSSTTHHNPQPTQPTRIRTTTILSTVSLVGIGSYGIAHPPSIKYQMTCRSTCGCARRGGSTNR
jgi:hypothetical protein